MKSLCVEDVQVEAAACLSDEEIELYVRSEIEQWRSQDKELASLSLQVEEIGRAHV